MKQEYERNYHGISRPQTTNIIHEKNPSSGNIIRSYVKGKMLGKVIDFEIQGGFAKCYELTSQENNKKFAVKIIEKASLTRSKAREKVKIIINQLNS